MYIYIYYLLLHLFTSLCHILYFDAAKFSIKQFLMIYINLSVIRRRNEYEIVTETQSIYKMLICTKILIRCSSPPFAGERHHRPRLTQARRSRKICPSKALCRACAPRVPSSAGPSKGLCSARAAREPLSARSSRTPQSVRASRAPTRVHASRASLSIHASGAAPSICTSGAPPRVCAASVLPSACASRAPPRFRASRSLPDHSQVPATPEHQPGTYQPLLSPRNFFWGGSRTPAIEAGVGAGAVASEADSPRLPESLDPPWPPELPAPPWVPEWEPSWRPPVMSPCPLRPPERPLLPVGCCMAWDASICRGE